MAQKADYSWCGIKLSSHIIFQSTVYMLYTLKLLGPVCVCLPYSPLLGGTLGFSACWLAQEWFEGVYIILHHLVHQSIQKAYLYLSGLCWGIGITTFEIVSPPPFLMLFSPFLFCRAHLTFWCLVKLLSSSWRCTFFFIIVKACSILYCWKSCGPSLSYNLFKINGNIYLQKQLFRNVYNY